MSDGFAARPVVEASLDVVVDGTLMGWARDLERPDDAALLQLRLGERRIAIVRADRFRPDLRDAGMGTGRHGFEVAVPPDIWERARRTGDVLTGSALGDPDRILFSLDNDERVDAPEWLRRYLADALTADAALSVPTSEAVRITAPSLGPLFAPASLAAAEGAPGLFRYAEHIRQLKGVAGRFEPKLIGPDLDHFFRWYIQDYAAERAPLRAPLSATIIRWLNEPVVIGGLRHAPTRALLWFLPESDYALSLLDDDENHVDILYWWACERAPALSVEDCLVSKAQVDVLRRCPEHWAGQAFPLSCFMERALLRRPALSRLGPMHSLSARVTAYTILLAEALDEPGLLRFVPQPVLDRLLGGAVPLLDTLSAELAGATSRERPLTARRYRSRLIDRGFDLDGLAFLDVDSAGNRWEAARFGAPPPRPTVDVQVIGPLGKASGVARAARQSRIALEATGLSVAACDCELDNRQPAETGSRLAPASAHPVPARVNLLHLNADMVPSAYAYLAGLDGGAYTIGFFFWELDRPAECHRLALDLVDEVWVASDYNRECFAAWTDKPVTNVGTALDLGPLPSAEAIAKARHRLCRAGPGDFVVLSSFDALSFVSRKNPLGLLRAFQEAFPGDPAARLVIKTHNTTAASDGFTGRVWAEVLRAAGADPRIVVVDETLPFEQVMALTAAADCFASLHRSEGLGLGILEAMRLGVPVMCTAYGGNMDVCDAGTAWLVEADEVPVGADDYAYVSPGHRWAEPRHALAVDTLRSLRGDPTLRRIRAAAARARVEERCSVAAAAERYRARLGEIMPELRRSLAASVAEHRGPAALPGSAALAGGRRQRP